MVERTNNAQNIFLVTTSRKSGQGLGGQTLAVILRINQHRLLWYPISITPDYVEIVCNSLEQLPNAFAKLDREKLKEKSVPQRSNKDAWLKKRICALIADEKIQQEKEENDSLRVQFVMQATEF